jgi:MFS transporter, SP family, solute carrier family 2 (myo-inositol transporter), member 13
MTTPDISRYRILLLTMAGMGGALYGYDLGIIGAALLYLDKSIVLSITQLSLIVAAVMAGSTLSSLIAGVCADWLGRRTVAILAGVMFLFSVLLMCIAHNFNFLLCGRLLQGLSGGMVAVVIPLYLAECLPAGVRGRGTALFQLALTIGIMLAMGVGALFAAHVDAVAATKDAAALATTQDHAWRWMFATAAIPGALFLTGCFLIAESPRWLQRRGRSEEALAALSRSLPADEAKNELASIATSLPSQNTPRDSLFKRRYIVPFLLACAILALTQATGINSVLQYIVVIFRQSGFTESMAANAAFAVTVVNVVFTILALFLVDRKGRTFLLKIGTGGVIISLCLCAAVFNRFESQAKDVTSAITSQVTAEGLHSIVEPQNNVPQRLTVVYDNGNGSTMTSAASSDPNATVHIATIPNKPFTINSARLGPQPDTSTGWLAMGCLMLFIASFAIGPGVCVWLALSELMPTRIRATGMGIALVLNQGVATSIAAVFLPVVGSVGYAVMFLGWAGATMIYFLIAAFILPETKGRTLEDIERHFNK